MKSNAVGEPVENMKSQERKMNTTSLSLKKHKEREMLVVYL